MRNNAIKRDISRQGVGDLLLQLASQYAGSRSAMLFVLPPAVTTGLVESLLKIDSVVAVLGSQEIVDASPADPRRILSPQTDSWPSALPSASALVIAEPLSVVSWQWIAGAKRSRIDTLITLEDCGNWRPVSSTWALVTQVLQRGGRKFFQRIVFGSNRISAVWERRLAVMARREMASEPDVVRDPKIFLVIGSLAAGGAERQLVHLANLLDGAGADVTILVLRLTANEDRHFLGDLSAGVRVLALPLLHEQPSSSLDSAQQLKGVTSFLGSLWLTMMLHPRFLEEVKRFREVFFQEKPTVVHAWLDAANVAAGLAAVLAGVPRVFLGGRSLAPFRFSLHQPYFRPLYRMLLSQPSVKMLNNSQAGLRDYAEWLDADEASMQTVYNGFAVSTARPPGCEISAWKASVGLPESAVVIGGVFRFSIEKDPACWIDVACRTLDKWQDKNVPLRFLLVGDGPLREQTEARAKSLAIDRYMVYVRRESRIALAMAAMDVLLLTSRYEGTPNVLIEAQALGCPVVTTDVGGCRETVLDGRTGWVAKASDSERLSERLLAVLADSTWRDEVRTKAPGFIVDRFGNHRLLATMCQLYGIAKC